MISDEVEKMDEKVINAAELKEHLRELTMDSDTLNKCTSMLHTTPLQYKKGDARVKVTQWC